MSDANLLVANYHSNVFFKYLDKFPNYTKILICNENVGFIMTNAIYQSNNV